jgi:hypothetical protein
MERTVAGPLGAETASVPRPTAWAAPNCSPPASTKRSKGRRSPPGEENSAAKTRSTPRKPGRGRQRAKSETAKGYALFPCSSTIQHGDRRDRLAVRRAAGPAINATIVVTTIRNVTFSTPAIGRLAFFRSGRTSPWAPTLAAVPSRDSPGSARRSRVGGVGSPTPLNASYGAGVRGSWRERTERTPIRFPNPFPHPAYGAAAINWDAVGIG